MLDLATAPGSGHTDGYVSHSGRIRVSCRLTSGALVTLVLPDDWQTLLNRVTALEAAMPANVPNSLEDLKYAG